MAPSDADIEVPYPKRDVTVTAPGDADGGTPSKRAPARPAVDGGAPSGDGGADREPRADGQSGSAVRAEPLPGPIARIAQRT